MLTRNDGSYARGAVRAGADRNERMNRKSTPKVCDGKVQRKNRAALSPHYSQSPQAYPIVDRQRPGQVYRHLITKAQLHRFIGLLPNWTELSCGLNAIVLAPGEEGAFGWHRPGTVAVCAWGAELELDWPNDYIDEHRDVLNRLGVETCLIFDRPDDLLDPYPGYRRVLFSETSARGFQLMHVLLHELGHHYDRMSTKLQICASRGEPYAEQYAAKYSSRIWNAYFEEFGW